MQATHNPFLYVHPLYAESVRVWLVICIVLIGVMVAVGGYTRLSGSGLSITEWKPIHGTIPPLNSAAWQEEFEKYQAIPQYQQINPGISLEEFKTIYWPEYWHRNLGRVIGLIYALPLFYFLFRRAFTSEFTIRLFSILALGGLQGLIGWIMVASGLQDRVYVSHLKLAIHFGTAMLLASALFWTWLDVKHQHQKPPVTMPHLIVGSFALLSLLILVQLVIGAMVAGLHAGLIYNSFPLMNGQWVADDVLTYTGDWFDHVPMVQFVHRWLGKLIVLVAFIWWFIYRKPLAEMGMQPYLMRFFVVLLLQFALGVLTLIHLVPLHLAILHQLGGFLLLLATLNLGYHISLYNNKSVQLS